MSKANSLEHINTKFKSTMEVMGIDQDRQQKLSTKLDLSKKIRTIISMQSMDERKLKIKEYIYKLSCRNSLMNLLSLHFTLDGPKLLYDIFTLENGHDVLISCMKSMDNNFAEAIVELIFMLVSKYENKFPRFMHLLLQHFCKNRMKETEVFYKLLEYLAINDSSDELYNYVDNTVCVCNTYLSKILLHIRSLPKIRNELNFIVPLLKSKRAVYVKYVLFISNFHDLALTSTVYEEIAKNIKNCKSSRIYEILRVAEKQGMLDLVCCMVEAFVFSDTKIFNQFREDVERGIKDIEQMRIAIANLELYKKVHAEGTCKSSRDNEIESTVHEQGNDVGKANDSVNMAEDLNKTEVVKPVKKLPSKLKVPKKMVKKTGVTIGNTKSYVPLRWNKIPKGNNTIWKDINYLDMQALFSEDDFVVFEKKAIHIDKPLKSIEAVALIFSDKKSYAINIALGRVKISNLELKNSILALECNIEENLIRQLLFYFPTPDEIQQLRNTESTFGRAEDFFKEAIDEVDELKAALSTLFFQTSFRNMNLMEPITLLTKYYTILINSQLITKFLQMSLFIGNVLNQGTFLANADAYSLESMPAVIENKDVIELIKRKIDFKQYSNELAGINSVKNVCFENLCYDMEEIKRIYSLAYPGDNTKKSQNDDKISPKPAPASRDQSGETIDKNCHVIQSQIIINQYNDLCREFQKLKMMHKKCTEFFGEPITDAFNAKIRMLYKKLCEE